MRTSPRQDEVAQAKLIALQLKGFLDKDATQVRMDDILNFLRQQKKGVQIAKSMAKEKIKTSARNKDESLEILQQFGEKIDPVFWQQARAQTSCPTESPSE